MRVSFSFLDRQCDFRSREDLSLPSIMSPTIFLKSHISLGRKVTICLRFLKDISTDITQGGVQCCVIHLHILSVHHRVGLKMYTINVC